VWRNVEAMSVYGRERERRREKNIEAKRVRKLFS
jgi:hypothetical protein